MKENIKELKKGLFQGLGILIILSVGGLTFWLVKSRTATDPGLGDNGSSLYTSVNETLTAAKRNALVKKANPQISTTEYDTGKKWIDGKIIYGQYIDVGTLSNVSSTTNLTKVVNISNIDQAVNITCIGRGTSANMVRSIGNNSTDCRYMLSNSTLRVPYIGNRTGRKVYAILEYTKN